MPDPLYIKKYNVINTVTTTQLADLVAASGLVVGNFYAVSDSSVVAVAITTSTYKNVTALGGGGGSAVWGGISGTLTDQVDLVAVLAGKQASDADLTSLSSATTVGDMYYRSAAGVWSPVTVGSGLDFTSGTLTSTVQTVAVTMSFGANFTDKTQTVVTGQPWVTAASRITTHLRTPAVSDPDEMYLLNFRTVVSDLVVGVGFTVTLYSEAQARGTYIVNCICV